MDDNRVPTSSWTTARLGGLITISTGKLDANAAVANGEFPFFTCAEYVSKIDTWAFDTEAVLLAGNGSFSVKRHNGKFNAYQRTYVIEPSGISIAFLYWLIRAHIRKITESERGSAIPYIRKGDITDIELDLPPPAEQKIIAARLDTQLAQVKNLKTRLYRIPTLLKQFRQSVLAAAVSGRLTGDLSYTPWINSSISDVCNQAFDGPFGSKLKSSDYTDSGARVARLENIGHLRFIEEKRTFVSAEKFESLTKNSLQPGDILFSSFVDEEIRTCLMPEGLGDFINKADCFCLRTDAEKVKPSYLVLALASHQTYEAIRKQVHGSTRPRINLRFLKAFEIKLPSVEEQMEIVRRVEQLFALADKIEAQINNAQQRVNNLTQSILAKAFSGELTADWRAQNPDLITGENSAAALLERIKAERAQLAKTTRKTTRRKKKT